MNKALLLSSIEILSFTPTQPGLSIEANDYVHNSSKGSEERFLGSAWNFLRAFDLDFSGGVRNLSRDHYYSA